VNKILNEELNKTRFVNHFVLRELLSGFQCSGYLMCVFVLIRHAWPAGIEMKLKEQTSEQKKFKQVR